MINNFDVIIIGAGISGVSTALSLLEANYHGGILLIDSGNIYNQRICHVDLNKNCQNCRPCNTFSGFGGSVHIGNSVKFSAFPSGKRLFQILGTNQAITYQEKALSFFEKTSQDFNVPTSDSFSIDYKTYPISISTEFDIERILINWYKILKKAKNVEILFNTNAIDINPESNRFIIELDNFYKKVMSKVVVVAVGRKGIFWWRKEIRKLELKYTQPKISKGLRFIVPGELLNKVSNLHPDFKTSFIFKDKKFKTFCLSAGDFGGRIKHANYNGEFMLIDGHGIYDKELYSKFSNFAILVQITEDTKPKSLSWINKHLIEPYVNANVRFPGKPLIQKYIDFKDKKISYIDLSNTEFNTSNYYCADLSILFNKDEHEGMCFLFEKLISEFITGTNFTKNINEVLINSYVLGIEIEGFWDVLELNSKMQSSIENLYVIGDCAGLAHGILQSSISGCVAANAIVDSKF